MRSSFKENKRPGLACLYLSYQMPQDLVRLLGSLVKQFLQDWKQLPESIEKIWEDHGKGESQATVFELTAALSELAEKRPLFIVIDALDECRKNLREPLIKALPKTDGQFSLLLTSRLLEDMSQLSRTFQELKVSAHTDDISYFLQGRIDENTRLQQFMEQDTALKDKIIRTIMNQCGGM